MRGHSAIGQPAFIVALLVLCCLTPGTGSAATPPTGDPQNRLNIWEGRWQSHVERKETPYSHAAALSSHFTCSWTADRGYMVCEYLSEEAHPSDHLTIFTYNDKDKTYKHLGISKDYQTLEEVAAIQGNIWSYLYKLPGTSGEKLDCRDTYEFVTPEKLVTRIEISANGGQDWTLLSESVATRVP